MMTPTSPPELQGLRKAWQQRTARERRLLLWAAALMALLLLWQWGIGPAWSVWRAAPVRQAQLDAQTQRMLQLQAEAARLQAPARLARPAVIAQLQRSADSLLGPGVQLQARDEHLHVSLQAAPAEGLAQWLAQAREQAQALPQQARLQRLQTSDRDTPSWQGSLVVRLP